MKSRLNSSGLRGFVRATGLAALTAPITRELALGRELQTGDVCAQETIHRTFEASGHNVRDLLVAITGSPAFRTRRAETSN